MEKKIDLVVVGDIQTNCWLYLLHGAPPCSGKQPCVVVDPGDQGESIVSRLLESNWIPQYILLTHGHFDHLAGLPKLLEAFEKGAFGEDAPLPKVGIHRQDAHYLGKNALTFHRESFAAVGASYVDSLWEPLPEADMLFEEGETVGPFKVLHVPGHTTGSVCFHDEKTGILFSGDTLFQGDYGRTDLPGGDWNQLRQSLERLLLMKPEIMVCPGHGSATTVREASSALMPL